MYSSCCVPFNKCSGSELTDVLSSAAHVLISCTWVCLTLKLALWYSLVLGHICFSFYNNVENEIFSIINAINNKNPNVLINVRESIYSSNSNIRKVLSDLRVQDVRPIGLVRTREQMVKSIFCCQPMLHRTLDTSQMNSLLAHLSEFTPLQLKDQNTL